jgi:acetyl-CoA acetyltransferase
MDATRRVSLNMVIGDGGVTLGYAIGASGRRSPDVVVYEFRGGGDGVCRAEICSGHGRGVAIIVEVKGG